MSFRPAPAASRRSRPSWERDDRRSLYINLGFVGSIILGLLLLVGAAAATYYDDHYGTIATVNETRLTKDDLRAWVAVDTWRIQRLGQSVQTALSTGRITQEQADAQFQNLQQEANQLPSSSLDKLVDATLQSQLAGPLGISVSDGEVDAALTKEATSPELRHVWVIATSPVAASDGSTPNTAIAAAKAKIEGALADLKAGKAWEEVAKTASDDQSAAKGGDLGWVSRDAGEDSFLAALFALESTGYTGVIADSDGTYRIGRVSEIEKSGVDPNYQTAITDAKVSLQAYRAVLRSELLKPKLQEAIVAKAAEPSVQRRVSDIFIAGSQSGLEGDQVKSSHILLAPNGDPSGAASLSTGDPAWAQAEASANTIYKQLQADPSKFEALAKEFSDDKGSGADGGKLPYYSESDVDPAFGKAIFTEGLRAGQILAPIRSSFGWHIIRFEERRAGASDRIKAIQTEVTKPGADFAAIAKAKSEAADAATGGEMGWIAKGQISPDLEKAIFAAPIGKVSEIAQTTNGFYLFLVHEETTRPPDAKQLTTLQQNAFQNWYQEQKDAAKIELESIPDKL